MKRLRSPNGQALVETTAFFLAFSTLLMVFLSFTKWIAIREKLLCAAKQGALLYSSGALSHADVEQQLRLYLTSGSPALDNRGLAFDIGPQHGVYAWALELDEVVVYYQSADTWPKVLGIPAKISERCVIKHAPHYWAPIQPWGGPHFRWND